MTVSPLLYIHGLNSSPASSKARILQAVMQRMGLAGQLRIPALHHHPRQAIAQLQQAIAELGRPLLVGSSLGGYYATFLARQHDLPMLLINPAVLPHRRFAGYLGEQCNHYAGERWWLDETPVQALAELEVPPPEAPARCQVWLQTADETLDYREAERYYRACALTIEAGGEHGFAGFALHVPRLLAFAGIAAEHWRHLDFSAFN